MHIYFFVYTLTPDVGRENGRIDTRRIKENIDFNTVDYCYFLSSHSVYGQDKRVQMVDYIYTVYMIKFISMHF